MRGDGSWGDLEVDLWGAGHVVKVIEKLFDGRSGLG